MSINIVKGPSEKDKSEYLISMIKDKANTKQNIFVIVPEQYTLEAEKVLIEKANLSGILNIEVLSFTRLSHRILSEIGGTNKPLIDDKGKAMILRKLLDEKDLELDLYKRVSKEDGFLKKLTALISEFKSQNINTQELRNLIEKIDGSPLLEKKIRETKKIYEKFNEYLNERYIDQEDAMDIMNKQLEESSIIKDSIICIDKFNGFSEQMYRAIEKISMMAREIYISVNENERMSYIENIFENGIYISKRLEEIAKISNIDIKTIDIKEKSFQNEEIEFLKNNIFKEKTRSWVKDNNNVELFLSQTPMEEIEEVAIRINDLVRNKGFRYRDILVISNQINVYESNIRRVFYQYEIPYFSDEKRDIMNNPIIIFILGSIETLIKNFTYEPLFKTLKTNFANINAEETEIIENYILKYGIKGERLKTPFDWGNEQELEHLNQIRDKFIQKFISFHNNLKTSKTIKEKTRDLYLFMEEMNLYEQLELYIEELRSKGEYEYLSENSQIWNIIIENMDQLVEILGDEKVSIKDYYKILKSGFASYEVGIIPTRIDEVMVGELERVKFHEKKAIFFIGLNDGIIPKDYKSEGIFLDEEKETMFSLNLRLVNQKRFKSIEEKFNFYSIISRAKDYLFMSYSISDNDYKALRPSFYLNQIKKIMNITVKSCIEQNNIEDDRFIITKNSSKKYMIKAFREYVDNGAEISKTWEELYKWYFDFSNKDIGIIKSGIFHKNQIEYIKKSKLYDLYSSPFYSSVSRLELFANCPFAHFVRYGLNPRERKTYEIKSPQMGEFFHDTIKDFAEDIKNKNLSWGDLNSNEIEKIVDGIVDNKMKEYENGLFKSSQKNIYMASRIKRISTRAINVLATQMNNSSFENIGNEVSFGYEESKYPAIEIELNDGKRVYLQGIIDRVDSYQDEDGEYIKIIDYKSSDKNIDLNKLYHGLQLQLVLYMYAILNKDENKKPAGIFYFKIDDPMINSQEEIKELIEKEISKKLKMKGIVISNMKIIKQLDPGIEKYSSIIPIELTKEGEVAKRSSALTEDEFDYILKHIDTLIKTMGHQILEGKICANPIKIKNETACDYCGYKNICQFDTEIEGNEYKVIKEAKKEEIIKLIKDEIGVEEDE